MGRYLHRNTLAAETTPAFINKVGNVVNLAQVSTGRLLLERPVIARERGIASGFRALECTQDGENKVERIPESFNSARSLAKDVNRVPLAGG